MESWRVNKAKDNITRYFQNRYWCPKQYTEGKFDEMYTNHPANKHKEQDEEKHRKREAYKNVRSQRTRYGENSTGNSISGKASLYPRRFSLYRALIFEYPRLTQQNYWDL